MAAEGGPEGRLDAQQRAAGFARARDLLRVVCARALDVVLESALERPDGVFHEERWLVHAGVRRHALERDVLPRRPRQRRQQLRRHLVAQRIEIAHPRREIAAADALREPLPGRAVAHRRERHHLIRRTAACAWCRK